MEDTVVPIVIITIIFGAPIAAWIVSRVLAHQERMEMIRHGVIPPPMQNDKWARKQMKYGGWQAGPMGPIPGAPMPGPMQNAGWGMGADPSFYAQRQLRKGITLSLIGMAILIGLSFIADGRPGPWLLGGLIPMFVGIAQIINAVLNGASPRFFGGQTMGSMNYGPRPNDGGPMGASQQVPPQQDTGAPYGWRPGPTTGLEKPVQPPDIRQ